MEHLGLIPALLHLDHALLSAFLPEDPFFSWELECL